MPYKNIKLFLKKYFIFLIPLFLFIIYFLYPLPQTAFKSFSDTTFLKRLITNEILDMYEARKTDRENIMSIENIKQCQDKCPNVINAGYSRGGFFDSNYYCKLDCEHSARMYEPAFFLKGSFSEEQKEAIRTGKYWEIDIYEIKEASFVSLFSKNFRVSLPYYYWGLTENFKFHNIVIIILILILYYILIIGISNTKLLEKQK